MKRVGGRSPVQSSPLPSSSLWSALWMVWTIRKSSRIADVKSCFPRIQEHAISIGTGIVDQRDIDEMNILQATFRAMHIAIAGLTVRPQHILVDGNRFTGNELPFTTIVDGDARCHAIAAASIIAKVTRDRIMVEQDALYPEYGFARHKGYGTAQHRAAIVQLRPLPDSPPQLLP